MPQPIDPQTEIGRSTAAERIQQIADRASLAAQARAAEDSASTQRNAETQVPHSAPKGNGVDRELRRRNPFVGRRKKKKQGEQKHREQEHRDQQARHFYDASEKDILADDPEAHEFDVEV